MSAWSQSNIRNYRFLSGWSRCLGLMQIAQEFVLWAKLTTSLQLKGWAVYESHVIERNSTMMNMMIKNSEISDQKLNGTVKIPGKGFENLGIRFECTLFDGISRIIENFVFHSQEMSGIVSLPSVGDRTVRFPVCHTPTPCNS